MRYVFADCELDTVLYVLHGRNRSIHLRPKVFQVLLYLLEHRAEVVSKDALIEAVWPGQYISEATLADVIRSIRRAVGDDSRRPRVIRTRHGHGYHFVAEVTAITEPPSLETFSLLSSPAQAERLPPEALSLATGERKVATVLYASLGHSATLSELLGLDALHRMMHDRYGLVQRIVQQYEGTIQPLQGDRVLAVFGIPMTHEDHAQRAALAALAIRDSLQVQQQTYDPRYHAALAIRLGLHTGPIAVETIGLTPEQTVLLTGDVVTLAMTLQEHADSGTILCSDATVRLAQEVTHVELHAPISYDDKSQNILS